MLILAIITPFWMLFVCKVVLLIVENEKGE